jgi:hypothetical protein
MDGRTTAGGEAAMVKPATSQPRRKKRGDVDSSARFFLPKEGSLPNCPELGPEMTSEGEALIRSLKADQVYFAVTTWKAVAEENGGNPVIVKQAFGG